MSEMSKEEAIELLRKINAECERHESCDHHCPFYNRGIKHCVFDGRSFFWGIPKEGEAE